VRPGHNIFDMTATPVEVAWLPIFARLLEQRMGI
jgi:hypothetical protein